MRHAPSFRTTSLAAALILLSAAPSLALDAAYRAESGAAPEAVWSKVGDFCGIAKWHPVVESCALSSKDGATLRTLSLKGGGAILEKLEGRDEAAHSYSYSIISSPLPVRDYQSVISVVPAGSGSAVVWTGKFNAQGASDAEAVKTIEGIYKAGADVLVK